MLNPKILVGVAIAAIGGGIVFMMVLGNSLLDGDVATEPGTIPQVAPVTINVDDVQVVNLNSDGATLELVLTITNPNSKPTLLSLVKYQIFESGERVIAGQVGTRSGGMVDSSEYYTILGGGSVTLRDRIVLENPGEAGRFWTALESGTTSWRVTGEAFFNLSSMTAGQENEVTFDQLLN